MTPRRLAAEGRRGRESERERLTARIAEALGISHEEAQVRALRELAERVAPEKPAATEPAHAASVEAAKAQAAKAQPAKGVRREGAGSKPKP